MDWLFLAAAGALGFILGTFTVFCVYELRLRGTIIMDKETGRVEGNSLPDKIVVYEGDKKTTFKRAWRIRR